mgnify:CR=1 FL=1
MRTMITFLLTGLMMASAQAELVKSGAEGFIVHRSVTIENDVAAVFETMTARVGQWWNPDHSFSGDAGNMLINEQCFCERWDGNLVRHLNTVIWREDSKIVMEGGLGPLKELGLNGTMIWALTANDDATTTLDWKYHVHGYSETDMGALATAVDGVLAEQLGRLAGAMAPE